MMCIWNYYGAAPFSSITSKIEAPDLGFCLFGGLDGVDDEASRKFLLGNIDNNCWTPVEYV